MNSPSNDIETRLSAADAIRTAPADLRDSVLLAVNQSLKAQMRRDDFKLIARSFALVVVALVGLWALLQYESQSIKSTVLANRPAPGWEFFSDGVRELTGTAPPEFLEQRFMSSGKRRPLRSGSLGGGSLDRRN